MNDPHDPAGAPDPGDREEPDIGTVGEEAAKLFSALAGAARQHGGEAGDGLSGLADHAAAMAHDVNEHLATDAVECRYCPVCRVVHAVRETSPEVKAHLTQAATSLFQAAAGFLETLPQPPEDAASSARGPEVEHIDLDSDDSDDSDKKGGDA
jgi:hypothetical protein